MCKISEPFDPRKVAEAEAARCAPVREKQRFENTVIPPDDLQYLVTRNAELSRLVDKQAAALKQAAFSAREAQLSFDARSSEYAHNLAAMMKERDNLANQLAELQAVAPATPTLSQADILGIAARDELRRVIESGDWVNYPELRNFVAQVGYEHANRKS